MQGRCGPSSVSGAMGQGATPRGGMLWWGGGGSGAAAARGPRWPWGPSRRAPSQREGPVRPQALGSDVRACRLRFVCFCGCVARAAVSWQRAVECTSSGVVLQGRAWTRT